MTLVDPTGKAEPETWVMPERVTFPELSIAVGSAHATITCCVPGETVSVMSGGQVTSGGLVSTIKTNRHLEFFEI